MAETKLLIEAEGGCIGCGKVAVIYLRGKLLCADCVARLKGTGLAESIR